MEAFNVSGFAALIGIDWADRKHDICEINRDTNTQHLSVISSEPKSINAWALELKQRYNGRPVAVACELPKGPLIYALSKFKHIILSVINPSSVAKYRAAFSHSRATDDPTDAIIHVEILQLPMGTLTRIRPDSEQVKCLAQLSNTTSSVPDRLINH